MPIIFKQAMMLAAGKGERMLPLTLKIPKPLLRVNNKPLINYGIQILKDNSISKIVVNTSHLKEVFVDYFSKPVLGIDIALSVEEESLSTGGGVKNALNLLNKEEPLLVLNSDIIFSDGSIINTMSENWRDDVDFLIAVVPVKNSVGYQQYETSDMAFIKEEWTVGYQEGEEYFFGGYYAMNPKVFKEYESLREIGEKFSIIPYFREAIKRNRFRAVVYDGKWYQASYPKDLEKLNQIFN